MGLPVIGMLKMCWRRYQYPGPSANRLLAGSCWNPRCIAVCDPTHSGGLGETVEEVAPDHLGLGQLAGPLRGWILVLADEGIDHQVRDARAVGSPLVDWTSGLGQIPHSSRPALSVNCLDEITATPHTGIADKFGRDSTRRGSFGLRALYALQPRCRGRDHIRRPIQQHDPYSGMK